jgi:KTSC domain
LSAWDSSMVRVNARQTDCMLTGMNMTDVESSMILSVGYDAEKKTMRVLFVSGKTFEYSRVPPEVYRELMDSGSKGSYMRSEVIDCFPTREMKGRGRH